MVEEILKRKQETIDRLKARRSIKEAILEAKKAGRRPIIAEVKRRGLKEGEKEIEIEVVEAANQMEKAGACAISVLTSSNRDFFLTSFFENELEMIHQFHL